MYRLILILILFSLSACQLKNQLWVNEKANEVPQQQQTPTAQIEIPWSTWDRGLQSNGQEFSSNFVELGDQLLHQGDFEDALQNYYLASQETASQQESEEVRIRISTALLADDKPNKALDELSGYYKVQGLNVSAVHAKSALIFAYIYGRLANFDQSFAWFSQSIRTAGNEAVKGKARQGAKMLFAKIPDDQFFLLRNNWDRDMHLERLLDQENSKRLLRGGVETAFNDNPRFWERETLAAARFVDASVGSSQEIIVMLPLSGRYASFGTNVKRGIELVLAGVSRSESIQTSFFDTEGSVQKVSLLCQELQLNSRNSIILGPLLSSTSKELAKCIKGTNNNLISFTKKSDFQTGRGVYRLGVTVKSQIRSLLTTSLAGLKLRKYAIVYPAEDAQRKFVAEFKRQLAGLRLSPEFEYSYFKNPIPDFNDLIKEIELYNPDALFIADDLTMTARIISSLDEQQRAKLRFLGTAEWANPEQLKKAKGALKGAIFPSPFLLERTGLTQKFVDLYLNQYNEVPDFLAAQGYDVATIVLAAMRKSIDQGRGFVPAFNNVKEYRGLTGKITVTSLGELNRRLKVVEYLEDGLFEVKEKAVPRYVYRGNQALKEEDKEVDNEQ